MIHLLPGLLHPEGPAGAPAGDKVTHPGSTFQDVAFSKNWSVSVRIVQAGRAGVYSDYQAEVGETNLQEQVADS